MLVDKILIKFEFELFVWYYITFILKEDGRINCKNFISSKIISLKLMILIEKFSYIYYCISITENDL